MKKVLVAIAVVMLTCGVANAFVEYNFFCDGTGNMVKNSPVLYTGAISSGALAPGTWEMLICDTGWPSTADPVARWSYIWTTYYTYNPATWIWTGAFQMCDLYLVHTGAGSMRGTCSFNFQVQDFNKNGILDSDECMDGMSGAVIIIDEGTGNYAELCGNGSYSGFYLRACDLSPSDPDYMMDIVEFEMTLWLDECGMGTEETTWGAVKALFR
ncbi:MAG: hypothetical protein WAW06_03170 [bacterium]